VDREAGDQFSAILTGIVDIARRPTAVHREGIGLPGGEAGCASSSMSAPAADGGQHIRSPSGRTGGADRERRHVTAVLRPCPGAADKQPGGRHQLRAGDMIDPAKVLAEAGEAVDFTQPVALTFMGVLGHIVITQREVDVDRVLDGLLGQHRPSPTASTRARRSKRRSGCTSSPAPVRTDAQP